MKTKACPNFKSKSQNKKNKNKNMTCVKQQDFIARMEQKQKKKMIKKVPKINVEYIKFN
jgi:hypothetical protein